MNRYIIGSLWDRINRNGVNSNFEYLFEGASKIDGIQSKVISNEKTIGSISTDVKTLNNLNVRTESLLTQAQKINNENKSVQSQIDSLILESGTSDAEVIQARGGKPLLKDRLNVYDADISKINEDFKKSFMYEKIYGTLSRYTKPSTMDLAIPFTVSVAPNGNFDYNYDVSRHKNTVSKRYYVDVKNGNNTNDGTESAPFRDLSRAFRYGDADEIVVKSGVYGWTYGEGDTSTEQTKPFNLIGVGDVYIGAHRDTQTWSSVSGRNNVFMTNASAVTEVLDIRDYSNPVFYTQVNSIDEVENTRASYYKNGNDIYVRPDYIGAPNDKVLLNMGGSNALNFRNKSKIYMENIKTTNTVTVDNSSVVGKLYAKNCDFSIGSNDNALSIFGDVYFELQNCRAMYAYRDGFNYHIRNGKLPRGWEIDCVGAYNGRDGADQNNGSTMHDGGKIGRVGGSYHHNHGPNVIDVNDGTQSLNIGVHAHSSTATNTYSNVDFRTRDDADMWLVNCISNGSDFSTSVEGVARLHKQNVLLLSPEAVI